MCRPSTGHLQAIGRPNRIVVCFHQTSKSMPETLKVLLHEPSMAHSLNHLYHTELSHLQDFTWWFKTANDVHWLPSFEAKTSMHHAPLYLYDAWMLMSLTKTA